MNNNVSCQLPFNLCQWSSDRSTMSRSAIESPVREKSGDEDLQINFSYRTHWDQFTIGTWLDPFQCSCV